MKISRRGFFKWSAAAAVAAGGPNLTARAVSPSEDIAQGFGCLVDTTLCVGCRKCEQACNQRHHLPMPEESFEEMTVLENERRMDEFSYTVVNKY